MTQQPTHTVFISHSHKDVSVAEKVCAHLESGGVRCWVAPRDVPAGEDWGGAIVRAISNTKVMVLLLSSASNESQQVLREVERAVSKGVRIIPVRLEEITLNHDLEYFLAVTNWLNAVARPIESVLGPLLKAVQSVAPAGVRQPPKPTPPSPTTTPGATWRNFGQTNLRWILAAAACLVVGVIISGVAITRPRAATPLAEPPIPLVNPTGTTQTGSTPPNSEEQTPIAQAPIAEPKSKAQALFEAAASAHRRGAHFQDPSELEQAEKLYNACLDEQANHVACHRNLAVLLVETDRAEKAFAFLSRWVGRNPDLADARIELARMYLEYGDRETAELQLLEAFLLDVDSDRVKAALSHLHEIKGELDEVRPEYRDKRDPFGSDEPLEIPTGAYGGPATNSTFYGAGPVPVMPMNGTMILSPQGNITPVSPIAPGKEVPRY